MRNLLVTLGLVLSGCSTLHAALLPTGIEVDGQVVLPLPRNGSTQALESALIPARGKRARVRVDEGVKYESLILVLHVAQTVGVAVVELEHASACRHDVPTDPMAEDVGPPHFTVGLASQGYYLAMVGPLPPNSDAPGDGKPLIAAVNGAIPFDALDARLKKDLPALLPIDGIILATEPGVGATDALRTWDVLRRQPGVRKVQLALLGMESPEGSF